MENYTDAGLELLIQKLLTMASHAETAVNDALQALQQRDTELALRVKDNDRTIDQFEVEIDDLVDPASPAKPRWREICAW